jgi:F-type H+-transporting ATPase subunit delta
MPENLTFARPYADALFSKALASDELDQWGEILRVLAMAASTPELQLAMVSPMCSSTQIEDILFAVVMATPNCTNSLQQSARQWLSVLASSNRLSNIDGIRKLYLELLDKYRGIERSEVVSARELTDAEVVNIKKYIEERFATKTILSLKVDDRLTGGLRISIKGLVLNGSIQNSIALLGDSLRG